MPGLFDSQSGGGILGSLGQAWNNYLDRQMSGPQQEAAFRNQAYRELQQQGEPNPGLLMANPPAYQKNIEQRNLMATIQALTPRFGHEGAVYFALHPDELSKLSAPQKVGPGEQLQAPLDIMGSFNNPQPTPQTMAPQPSMTAQPQATPRQGGGTGPTGAYQGPMNTNGLVNDATLGSLAERRLKGDKEVFSELGGGLGGMGTINRTALQNKINDLMKMQNISPTELAARDAKFPAYQDALKRNAEVSSRMQLAQNEARQILPLFKQAITKLNPTDYPIFNKVKQEWQAQTGNPASAEAASYMNALINTYARGVAPSGGAGGGASVNATEHLREVVNPFWSGGQLEAGANAVMKELEIANNSILKNQNEIDVRYGFGKKASPEDEAVARQALARGAKKEEIIRRFEENGFNAPKF